MNSLWFSFATLKLNDDRIGVILLGCRDNIDVIQKTIKVALLPPITIWNGEVIIAMCMKKKQPWTP